MAKWAEQEERDLLLGVSIGLPYVEMAEILDRSISSLYKKVYKLRNSDKVKDTNARYYLSNKYAFTNQARLRDCAHLMILLRMV